jgi:S-adenosylmethionine synthetase
MGVHGVVLELDRRIGMVENSMNEVASTIADHAGHPDATLDKVKAEVLAALKEQDRKTRHACAEAVTNLAASVATANVNQHVEYACLQLDRAAAIIMNVNTEAK